MRHRDSWQKSAGVGASLLLTLLILGAGCCLFDHDGDGMDDHGMPQNLCSIMLTGPAVDLTLSGPAPRDLVASAAGARLTAVPLSVLDPPPRDPALA